MHLPEAKITESQLAERYRVLLDIGRTLSATLGTEELFRAIYRETSRVLETAGFYIALYDQALDMATVVFYADRGIEKHVEITYRGSDSEVIRTGRASLLNDRAQGQTLLVLGDHDGELTRGSISAPLLHSGRVLGAISAQSYNLSAYSEDDLELLQGIADIAAVAVENARYVDALDKRRREAERIEEIGRALASSLDPQEVLGKVIDTCLSLIPAERALVWLVEGGSARATVAAAGGAAQASIDGEWQLDSWVQERLLVERVPLTLDLESDLDLAEEVRLHLGAGSVMAAPLIVGGDVGGILSVGSERGQRFDDEDHRVLQRLSSQASVALENARLHANLQSLSLTDPLTGVSNRRHLQVHLDKEVAAARRGRAVVTVIFDIDQFKLHNDTLGHLVGDGILRTFAKLLSEENRAMNMVARYGGDEFVSVLSETRMEGARLYVQRVAERVATDPLLSRHRVTVSSGSAAFDRTTMTNGQDMLKQADLDLYRKKARGSRSGPPRD